MERLPSKMLRSSAIPYLYDLIYIASAQYSSDFLCSEYMSIWHSRRSFQHKQIGKDNKWELHLRLSLNLSRSRGARSSSFLSPNLGPMENKSAQDLLRLLLIAAFSPEIPKTRIQLTKRGYPPAIVQKKMLTRLRGFTSLL